MWTETPCNTATLLLENGKKVCLQCINFGFFVVSNNCIAVELLLPLRPRHKWNIYRPTVFEVVCSSSNDSSSPEVSAVVSGSSTSRSSFNLSPRYSHTALKPSLACYTQSRCKFNRCEITSHLNLFSYRQSYKL
jgi:hypothetical protein